MDFDEEVTIIIAYRTPIRDDIYNNKQEVHGHGTNVVQRPRPENEDSH